MLILICNVGSTSLKFKLYTMPDTHILCEAKIERVGSANGIYSFRNNLNGAEESREGLNIPGYSEGINLFLKDLVDSGKGAIRTIDQVDAIGFKTVIAKGYYGVHELSDEVIAAMEAYIKVAPAHNPPYIEAIRKFKEILPDKLFVGVFETAFHKTIPQERRMYSIPYEWYENYDIQRLGYHGASHGYISRQVEKRIGKQYKLISCHLGGSGSLCAVLDGKSVDSSFGFSPQTGIPHANRAGDIDANIIPFLLGQGLTVEEIFKGIDKNGGLLGISGVSNDLRDIEEAAAQGNERAKLAIDVYADSIIKYIGSFYAVLGGLDYLVFTGGIGENSSVIRQKICSRLTHLGVELDEAGNVEGPKERVISADTSKVKVCIIPTNEEEGIAQDIFHNYAV
ncbi:acetate/propionate family kinase [Desulfitobacterium chlororespirans]|uniref:Acetate kinase n=1 Tax=Desulfitobacterium chlororespirans DSM 11544 TaxID=1121395 RepID=A0A1M7UG37_9FIRM|nr:acetate/propionate family kinase [Desulfitobacterium chlororespirans]SHN81904.1 acetate kinase [Desulfitobacterium chlororespirans DSM 11544]